MRTKHPYPYNYQVFPTREGWELWFCDENEPESREQVFSTEQDARRAAAQLNLEYELHNIPTP